MDIAAPTYPAVLELFAFLVTLCAAGAFTKLRMTSLARAPASAASKSSAWGLGRHRATWRAADARRRRQVGEILAGAMLGPPLAAFQRYPRRVAPSRLVFPRLCSERLDALRSPFAAL